MYIKSTFLTFRYSRASKTRRLWLANCFKIQEKIFIELQQCTFIFNKNIHSNSTIVFTFKKNTHSTSTITNCIYIQEK